MKRRIFSLFLALTLVVGMLPAPAFAEETEHVHTTEAPTEAPATEAPAAEPTQPTTEAPKATEAPAPETTAAPAEAQAPTQDEAVTAAQAMIDALPDVDDMSEGYIDALEAAYSAFEALTETQQAQITGVEKLEALFGWVNGQVSTLADDVKEISGDVTWSDKTFTTPVKLTGATTLTLEGTNKIECDAPLDLNGFKLTIKGTGTLEVIGDGRSKEYQCNGAIFDSTYTGRTAGAGTLILEGGTVKASGGTHNAISLYAVDLKGGNLEAYGGVRSGLACSYLYARSGSIYATGGEYGIYAAVYRGAYNLGNLTILASDEKEASPAEMDEGDIDEINDNAKKKTYYIGEVSGPMLSVKAQKGTLYEDTANQTATFAISARNVDTTTLKAQWVGDHTGLTQRLSADGKTLTVTTDATVKQGTYSLTVTVADADGTTVFKTVTVTVSGPPITITTQPKDASVSCKNGDLDSWQGDKEVLVAGTLAEGLTGNISYQWKLGDGTDLDGFTQSTVTLKDLYQYLSGEAKLTQQTDKPWLSTAKVYCTLAYGSYSVDTDTVTLTVNTCAHDLANPDGTCQQCGEPCSQEPMLIHEDGTYIVVQEESGIGAAEVGGNLVKGGTFYLTKDMTNRGLNAGNTTKDNKDTILDLQSHTLAWLNMDNFPYGTFTLKNGTLNQPVSSNAGGVLILDGVTFGSGCFQATNYNRLEITVKGNTLFRETVSFNKPVHLQGGTFEKGIDTSDGTDPLELLDEGYAYQDSQGNIVDASIPEDIAGKEIQVVAHKCDYVNGKCACGRSCDHEGTVDADGYCTFCHALVEAYAIGETRYTSLEDALDDAKDGDTITLRGDFYQGYKTVEINKSVTLELGNHTLTGNAEDPVLRVMAENVTIQNGSVENTNTAKSRQAVTVGKTDVAGLMLTVKDVTFTGSTNGVIPRNSGLSVQSGNTAEVKSGTFTGGIYVEGNLTMTGGSATILERGFGGTVQLSGGSFDRICFPNPPEDYEGLLAEGYAYQSGTSLVKPEDMNSSTAVQVVKCTHPDGLSGDTPCPYCGKTCDHKNVNRETGLCPDCGYQVYRAKIGDTLYATAEEALDAATDSQTVKLLADGTLADYKLDKNITLSLDGNTLRGDRLRVTGNVTVSDGGEINVPMEITGGLTLESAASLLGNVMVNGSGSLVMNSAQATAQGITVNGSGSFELRGGSIARLSVASGTATLYSGRIHYSVSVSNGNLQSILADGKALVLMANGNVVDGTQTTAAGKMEIADHTHAFGEDGKCACGVQASIQVEAGEDSFYFGDFEGAVSKAASLSGSTVRLLENVTHSGDSGIYIESGTFTIDWNGCTLTGSTWSHLLVISKSANVTLTDSSGNNAGGVRNTGSGTAVCAGMNSPGSVKIQGGTYSPNVTKAQRCYGSVQISGGVFENSADDGQSSALYDESGKSLSGMLAEGYAFAYDADGSELLNAYTTSMSANYRNVYVVAHTHEFEDGVCACGYECPHEHWTDGVCDLCDKVCDHPFYADGKCTVCGSACHHWDVSTEDGVTTCKTCGLVMTVMVQIPNEIIQYTTDLAAAMNQAEDGTYITLLDDVVLTSNADVVDGKEVALDMNGHDINQNGRTLNVAGTDSKLIIKGAGDLSFTVNIKESGQLDMSGWTGTVVNVNLSGVCDFVGPTGDGHIDNLNIGNWRNGNVGTITLQGGTIGKLWLNSFEDFQITLGSLLKSGYAAKNDSGYLPYDKAIKYVYQGQRENILYDLTIVACPHTGLDDTGRCTYCNKTGFAAMVTTKDGVTTGYADFNSALLEVCNGKSGTLKLLQNQNLGNSYQYDINGTLDLNGKTLGGRLACSDRSDLRIENSSSTQSKLENLFVKPGGKVTIVDTRGNITFGAVTVCSGSVADLLPEGGAYRSTLGKEKWISAEEAAGSTSLTNVTVQEAPVKSVTLTANKDTVTYGESQTVTLTADSTLADAVTASYTWYEIFPAAYTEFAEAGTSFTLPEGVSGGVHTYKVSVTADGYTLSKTIEITVTKAEGTLTKKDYPTAFTYGETIPEPKRENFISNNLDGEFRYSWERKQDDGLGTLPAGEVPSNAGTYFLHVEIASDGNYETVRNSFTVTINPLTITSENIVYDLGDDLIYNGKSQSPTFRSITANGKELDYTVTGNTETNAGSYTMTVTGRGNNFTGSVEIDWKILPRDLSKADVTLGDALTYNGREQTQTVDSVTLEGMDSPLTEGKDFQVISNTRTDAGSYSLSIAPVNNNFTGSKDVPWSIAPMDISKATAVRVSHDPLTYNGQPQTPTGVTVVVDGLTATVDVNASPRTNAAMYDMTVTGTGNFTGSRAVNWYIHKKSIENAETIAMDKQLTYNGQEQTQNVVSVTVDYLDATFEVTGNTGTNAGNYTMTIRGTGNFTGTLDAGWNIAPKSLGKATIVLGDDPTYNFGQQTKTVTSVTVDGISGALTEGVDYTVSGNTGTDAGDYTLRVFGKGNFTDGKEIKWAIKPLDITDKVTTILGDGNPDLIYNGKEQTPKITAVRVKVATEEKEITFRVDVTPQVNVGRDYPMAIVATGNFTGRIDGITWEIKPRDISDAEVVLGESLTYNGSQQTQTITSVTVDGLDVTYDVTGNTGTDAGSYTMTLTGNVNFTGSQDVSWSIAKKDIGDAKIVLGAGLTYNDEEQTQTVASVTVDGLDVPTYTVTGNTGKNANNDYTLTVKADGNFIGTQTAKWSIDPLDISKAATFGVMFDDPTYNGQEQTPDVVSAEVLIGTKLVKITFQVDVTPQVNAGEYKLAIIGTGNYTGQRDGITWKIKPKSIAHAEIVFGPELTYNGQKQTQTITSVTVDGLDVTYSVVGRSNTGTDAEGYALCIEGTGNFTGICFDEFEIARKDVTIGNVTVESTKVYDGTTEANITSVGTLSDNYDGDGLQIVSGTAAYDDKNVGTGKTVTFTGFSLSGDRADNYNLVSQPDPVTADITAKEITLTVTVKDKNFDGTTKAELDTVTHTDFVAGDDVKLENGEPSFAYPCVRADIPIGFTDFRLTGADAGNYQLTNAQPEGVTAEIHPTPNYLDVTNKPEFDGKTTVTIDGQEYPIEEMGDRRYVNLPETGDLLTIYSFQNGTQEGSYTNYPTGMQVFRITRQEGGAKAEEITEFDNLLSYVGCSIRITGKKGIRMITAIDQTVKKSLINKKGLAGYTLEEYGTVVQWADSLGSDTLNLDSGKGSYAYKKGKADPVFAKVDGMVQYTNVLVGFSDAQLEPNLVMRPYIKLKDIATGETVTLYGGCVTRSIGYVAWQNRNTYKEGTASYKYVWGIINKIEDTSKYPTN